jgi:hypothetical protein
MALSIINTRPAVDASGCAFTIGIISIAAI